MIFNHFNTLAGVEGRPRVQQLVLYLGTPSVMEKMPSGGLFVSYIFRHTRFRERIRFDIFEDEGRFKRFEGYKEQYDVVHGTWKYKGKVEAPTVEAWCRAIKAYDNVFDIRKVPASVLRASRAH